VVSVVIVGEIVNHHCVDDTTLSLYQSLATDQWFSSVSSTNQTDCHDITETLLKVTLNTINQTKPNPCVDFI
jgi:hypothetical protein